MTRALKSEGFVLRKMSLPSKDAIFVLLSKDYGKIRVFAKGVKKITSRRLPHLQTGNLIHFATHEYHTSLYVESTSLISGFTTIKNDPERVRAMYALLFLLERLLAENQPEPDIYITVKTFMVRLAKENDGSKKLIVEYANKILTKLGYIRDLLSWHETMSLVEDLINERMPEFIQ